MNHPLSFAPFIVFAVGAHLGLTEAGLWVATLCSLGLILRVSPAVP